jgi:hypothetical protein
MFWKAILGSLCMASLLDGTGFGLVGSHLAPAATGSSLIHVNSPAGHAVSNGPGATDQLERCQMTELTSSEIERIAGRLDDSLVVEILETGATREELIEALDWIYADDVMARDLHREPAGRIAVLCEILSRTDLAADEEDGPAPPAA